MDRLEGSSRAASRRSNRRLNHIQAEAQSIGEKIYKWLDHDKCGYLDLSNFFDILPPNQVLAAFALFDKARVGKVTQQDMVSGVQDIYRQRKVRLSEPVMLPLLILCLAAQSCCS